MSRVLRSAASRLEELLIENRDLKQSLLGAKMSMQAIFDEYDTTEHPVVEALQGALFSVFDDDDVFEGLDDGPEDDEGLLGSSTGTTASSGLIESKAKSQSKRDISRQKTIDLLKSVQELRQKGKMVAAKELLDGADRGKVLGDSALNKIAKSLETSLLDSAVGLGTLQEVVQRFIHRPMVRLLQPELALTSRRDDEAKEAMFEATNLFFGSIMATHGGRRTDARALLARLLTMTSSTVWFLSLWAGQRKCSLGQ